MVFRVSAAGRSMLELHLMGGGNKPTSAVRESKQATYRVETGTRLQQLPQLMCLVRL